ncbi:hypothetical protein DBR36_07905 [Microbacterium sp. HMWF026]|uniref:hypothetical protein n=1 Tax=Microbacterium sp. HMWF026 TaxID=2056861 RepID=UPI000D3D81EC|nr:hypothetical protein [Microbacterium sp. HMWF026]PTT19284.1 hypothetical protein DBR36_07905 [Microbacterium sp. HMWF026]
MTLSDEALTALEEARARVRAQFEQARKRSEDAARMAGDVRTATAAFPGREVRVIATSGGRVAYGEADLAGARAVAATS